MPLLIPWLAYGLAWLAAIETLKNPLDRDGQAGLFLALCAGVSVHYQMKHQQ